MKAFNEDAHDEKYPSGVAVVGSVNEDVILQVPRIPRPGETLIARSRTSLPGGKGANAATASARVGGVTSLVAAVGDDPAGYRALRDLEAEQVDVTSVLTVDAGTGSASITVDPAGENTIVVHSGANSMLPARHVRESLQRLGPAMVVVNFEVLEPVVAAAVAHARESRCWLVVNPSPFRPLGDLGDPVTLLVCNQTEAELVLSTAATGQPRRDVELLTAMTGGPAVLTLGAEGAVVAEPGVSAAHAPAERVTTVDTTGAGDAFLGALACQLAQGATLIDAVRFGVRIGTLATRALGARGGVPRLMGSEVLS